MSLLLLVAAPAAASSATDPGPILERLARTYRRLHLPMPPEDAPLIQLKPGTSGEGSLLYAGTLGFAGAGKEKTKLLAGTEWYDAGPAAEMRVLAPAEVDAGTVPLWITTPTSPFQVDCGLALAVQCYTRGWHDLADRLLRRSLQVYVEEGRDPLTVSDGRIPSYALGKLAWDHWENELLHAGTDRAFIAGRMQLLLLDVPELADTRREGLLEGLQATLAPHRPPANAVEAQIEALVDLPFSGVGYPPSLPALSQLKRRGFAAVPAIIHHLHDDRLTRSVKVFANGVAHYTVSSMMWDALDYIAGDEWIHRLAGRNLPPAGELRETLAWWRAAKRLGEKTYLSRYALPADARAVWPNEGMLWLIEHKHPGELPTVYRRLLRSRPWLQSRPVTEALRRSSLPARRKILLFQEGAHHASLEHRLAALIGLADLDQGEFARLLVRTLNKLPVRPQRPYSFCEEARFARLISDTDAPEAWRALLQATRRADVGLRLQLLDGVRPSRAQPARFRRAVQFLAAFLDDPESRDVQPNSPLWKGPYAGRGFPHLVVRDYAALRLGRFLKLSEGPDPGWDEAQWGTFREAVRQAVQAELKRTDTRADPAAP